MLASLLMMTWPLENSLRTKSMNEPRSLSPEPPLPEECGSLTDTSRRREEGGAIVG